MNITYEVHTYQRKKDKENGKKGKEKIVQIFWIRLQIVSRKP